MVDKSCSFEFYKINQYKIHIIESLSEIVEPIVYSMFSISKEALK